MAEYCSPRTTIIYGIFEEKWFIAAICGFILLGAYFAFRDDSDGSLGTSQRVRPKPPNEATRIIRAKLRQQFPDITYINDDLEYFKRVNSYWATQAREPKAALLIKPRNTTELSSIVQILAEAVKASTKDAPVLFAVRSGGHSPNKGFANVEAGIVIDLNHFTAIELSHDHKTVTIEPGATWATVYRKLEANGLAVAGGRSASVGVGGLTLGGGLSFFSPQVGFVCDAIEKFEVVLADGSIVTASAESHSDLAIALRGGGNNFGIATKFTARTFPQKKVWGGHLFHWPSAGDRLIRAYHDFSKPENYDKKATIIFTLTWAPYLPFSSLPVTLINYTDPTPNDGKTLAPFVKERRLWSTLAIRTLEGAAELVQRWSASGQRDLFHATTFENDLEVMQFAQQAWKESLADVKKVSGVVWSLCFQPLVPSATLHHASNSMGLKTNKTLTIAHASIAWNHAKHDDRVHKAAEKLIDRIEEFAKKKGVYHSWKYANYCSVAQNPYMGYGKERHKFLREVSKKYDPDGVFQEGVPGHKLWN